MTTLTDILNVAQTEANQQYRESRERDRRGAYDRMAEYWDSQWSWAEDAAPALPDYKDLGKRQTFVSEAGRYGDEDVSGWVFDVDGIRFLYETDYPSNTGLAVLVTCPDCGAERVARFYGAAQLAKTVRIGRDYHHACEDLVAKRLAATIRRAAEDAKVSEQEIVERAMGW
jgi:hypothetical protein